MIATGRTRYRLGWRKRLVLQVEWLVDVVENNGGRDVDTSTVREWRDATVEDLQALLMPEKIAS